MVTAPHFLFVSHLMGPAEFSFCWRIISRICDLLPTVTERSLYKTVICWTDNDKTFCANLDHEYCRMGAEQDRCSFKKDAPSVLWYLLGIYEEVSLSAAFWGFSCTHCFLPRHLFFIHLPRWIYIVVIPFEPGIQPAFLSTSLTFTMTSISSFLGPTWMPFLQGGGMKMASSNGFPVSLIWVLYEVDFIVWLL